MVTFDWMTWLRIGGNINVYIVLSRCYITLALEIHCEKFYLCLCVFKMVRKCVLPFCRVIRKQFLSRPFCLSKKCRTEKEMNCCYLFIGKIMLHPNNLAFVFIGNLSVLNFHFIFLLTKKRNWKNDNIGNYCSNRVGENTTEILEYL